MEILWHYEDGKYGIFGVKQMHTKQNHWSGDN